MNKWLRFFFVGQKIGFFTIFTSAVGGTGEYIAKNANLWPQAEIFLAPRPKFFLDPTWSLRGVVAVPLVCISGGWGPWGALTCFFIIFFISGIIFTSAVYLSIFEHFLVGCGLSPRPPLAEPDGPLRDGGDQSRGIYRKSRGISQEARGGDQSRGIKKSETTTLQTFSE